MVNEGVGILDDLEIYSIPGSSNVSLELYSNSIDYDHLKVWFKPFLNGSNIGTDYVTFDFRTCIVGEVTFESQ
jgi:hypothetical protein